MQTVRHQITKEQYEHAKTLKTLALEEYAETIFPGITQWQVYWIYNMWVTEDPTTGTYWLNANISNSCD